MSYETYDDLVSDDNMDRRSSVASNTAPTTTCVDPNKEHFCRLTKMMSVVAANEYTPTANMIQSTLQYHNEVLRNVSQRRIESEEKRRLDEEKAAEAVVLAANEARQDELTALANEKMKKIRLYRYRKPYFAPHYPPVTVTPTHSESINDPSVVGTRKKSSAVRLDVLNGNDDDLLTSKNATSAKIVASGDAQGSEGKQPCGEHGEKNSSGGATLDNRRSVTFMSTALSSHNDRVEAANNHTVIPKWSRACVDGENGLRRKTPSIPPSSRALLKSYNFPSPKPTISSSEPSDSNPTADSELAMLIKKGESPREFRKRQKSLYKYMSGRLASIYEGGFYSSGRSKPMDILKTAKELSSTHTDIPAIQPSPPRLHRSSPSKGTCMIPLTLISVPETITLRAIYEECSSKDDLAMEDPFGMSFSDSVGTDLGIVRQSTIGGVPDKSNNMQSSRYHPLLLDVYHLIVLLHRAKVTTVPPNSEINKIIAKILLCHLGEGDQGMSSGGLVQTNMSSSRRIYSGDETTDEPTSYPHTTKTFTTLTGNNTNSITANSAAVGSSPTIPTTKIMTFEMFLEAVQLAKEWGANALSTYDASNSTFIGITANRSVTSNPSIYPSALKKDFLEWTLTPRNIACDSDRRRRSDNDVSQVGDDVNSPGQNGSVTDASVKDPNAEAKNNRNLVRVSDISAILASLGMEFDFVTLLKGVDPYHFDGEHISAELFRWITGSEDPSVVKSFCTLGGEDTLSGTIPTEVLIAKCSAMNMTPQFIANFVAVVDANGDGVVDYNEFLAMILKNRQETEGNGNATKRDWSEKDLRLAMKASEVKRNVLSKDEHATEEIISRDDIVKSEEELSNGNLLDFFTLVTARTGNGVNDTDESNHIPEERKQNIVTSIVSPFPRRRRISFPRYKTSLTPKANSTPSSLTTKSPFEENNQRISFNLFESKRSEWEVDTEDNNNELYEDDVFADPVEEERRIDNIADVNAKKILKSMSRTFFDEDGLLTESSEEDDYGWDDKAINKKKGNLSGDNTSSSFGDFEDDTGGVSTDNNKHINLPGDAMNSNKGDPFDGNKCNVGFEVDLEGYPIHEDMPRERARMAKHLQMRRPTNTKQISISHDGKRHTLVPGVDIADERHDSKVVTLGIGAVLSTENSDNDSDRWKGEHPAKSQMHQGRGWAIKTHVDKLVNRTKDAVISLRKKCKMAMDKERNNNIDLERISSHCDGSFRVPNMSTARDCQRTNLRHTLDKCAPPTCPRLYALPEKKIELLDAAVKEEQTKLLAHRRKFAHTERRRGGSGSAHKESGGESFKIYSNPLENHTIITRKPVVASRYLSHFSHSPVTQENSHLSNFSDEKRVKYKAKKHCKRSNNRRIPSSTGILDGDLIFYGTSPPSMHLKLTTVKGAPHKDNDCERHKPIMEGNGVRSNDTTNNDGNVFLTDHMTQSINHLKGSSNRTFTSTRPILSAGRIRAPRDNVSANARTNDNDGQGVPRASSRSLWSSPKRNFGDNYEMIMMHNPTTVTPKRVSPLPIRHNTVAANAVQERALRRVVRSHLYMSLPAYETQSMRPNSAVIKASEDVNNMYGFREKKLSRSRPPSAKNDRIFKSTSKRRTRPNTAGCSGVDRTYNTTGGRILPSSASRVRDARELYTGITPTVIGSDRSVPNTAMYTDILNSRTQNHGVDYHSKVGMLHTSEDSTLRSREIEQQVSEADDVNVNAVTQTGNVNSNTGETYEAYYYEIPNEDDSDEGTHDNDNDKNRLGNGNYDVSALDDIDRHFSGCVSGLPRHTGRPLAMRATPATAMEEAQNKAVSYNMESRQSLRPMSGGPYSNRPQSASRVRML